MRIARGTSPPLARPEGGAQDVPRPSEDRYRRLAWLIVAVAFLVFCGLAYTGGRAVWQYAQQPHETHTAALELAHGHDLQVRRAGQRAWSLVSGTEKLSEGDEVRTGQDTDALVTLFDNSTLHLDNSTAVTLKLMRSSHYITQLKDIRIDETAGSIVAAAAPLVGYTSMKFHVVNEDNKITVEVPESAVVRVEVPEASSDNLRLRVTTLAGTSRVRTSAGPFVDVPLDKMCRVFAGDIIFSPEAAITDLVKNANFHVLAEGADSHLPADWTLQQTADSGGLNIRRVSEPLGNTTFPSMRFSRCKDSPCQPRDVATVRLHQDLNVPVGLYQSLAVSATVKVAGDKSLSSGVYPLTLRVLYDDSNGQQATWERVIYPLTAPPTGVVTNPLAIGIRENLFTNLPTSIPEQAATWELVNQTPRPSRVKAVEVVATGTVFDVWVSRFSLIAR